MSIEDNFQDHPVNNGATPALVAGATRLTHAELSLFSERMAAALAARGIEPGGRVIVFMENSWEAIVSTFAVLKAGAVVVPVDPTATAEAVIDLANDCRATGLITQSSLATVTAAAMAETPSFRLTVIAGCQGAPAIDGIMRFEDAIAAEAVRRACARRCLDRPSSASANETRLSSGMPPRAFLFPSGVALQSHRPGTLESPQRSGIYARNSE